MKKKSLKSNAILNAIKTIISIIFPLITFPYASRILQIENLGKVNFGNSIIGYFSLIASLGISTYAIREGSGVRNDRNKFTKFASQIYSINIISTIIAYLGLLIIILLVPQFYNYKKLLLIQSIVIFFTTLGVDWIYSIYEDYMYITMRSLIFQCISVILLISFVKNTNDYYLYAMIIVISSVGSNLLNFLHSRKYCKIRFTKKINLKKNLKPILVIFSTCIATTIYVNSDTTMLGVMVGDYSVGIYSVSVKIYSIIKQMLSAVIIVSLPRLSFYLANKEKELYNHTITKIFNVLLLLILPAIFGINILCNQIITIIAGSNYIEANTSLRILSIALLLSVFAYFMSSCILIPMKKERYMLKGTIISAVTNILLNLILIPLLKQNGAAITTAIAEFIVLFVSFHYSKKYVKFRGVAKNFITSIMGCLVMVLVSVSLKSLITNFIPYTIATGVCCVFAYCAVLLLLKNEFACELVNGLKMKLRRMN